MYQISFSIAEENEQWYKNVNDSLSLKIKNKKGLLASQNMYGRMNVSIAVENDYKMEVISTLKETLTEMYIDTVKEEYLRERIDLSAVNNPVKTLLLHTLKIFDRDNEREIIRQKLHISNNMALEGIFHFLLSELKGRWNQIALLATDNTEFLASEGNIYELIHFLISAINPKVEKLVLKHEKNLYKLIGEYDKSVFEYNIFNEEQLLLYLIDMAPGELFIEGEWQNKELLHRIVNIFDAKSDANF